MLKNKKGLAGFTEMPVHVNLVALSYWKRWIY